MAFRCIRLSTEAIFADVEKFEVICSVSDPDPGFFADPDPDSGFFADPDPDPGLKNPDPDPF